MQGVKIDSIIDEKTLTMVKKLHKATLNSRIDWEKANFANDEECFVWVAKKSLTK